ncbi:hypothetical protein M9Y10_001866 [Tritrichomonas musculus]|uniref:PPM-type phosphatase domain-containing protein n=1 Tax=Tritrichomonas musculus TaxID=1915356 RepID=A0ABR2L864_9EUKA
MYSKYTTYRPYNNLKTIPHRIYSATPPIKKFGEQGDIVELGVQNFPVGYADTIGRRPTMEDSMCIVGDVIGDNTAFYGMFDGHGGKVVSHTAARQMYRVIADNYEGVDKLPSTIEKAIDIVNSPLVDEYYDQGSTMAIAIVVDDIIFTANLGDTRIVLTNQSGAVKRVTYDHRATDPVECSYVEERGGMVYNGRVNGSLMLTRCLGDGSLSPYLSQKPFMTKTPRKDGIIMIIACDGVWDVLTDNEAALIARKNIQFPIDAAQAIVDEAYKKGSTDNISCIVVNLTPIISY